jgi:UrcA family protein
MICSTTQRTVLSLAGSLILTLGAFSMLRASSTYDAARTALVRYDDVNLDRPGDVTRLYQRILSAAKNVCGPAHGADLGPKAIFAQCVDEAVARAVNDVNQPQLHALHSARIGGWQAASERRAKPGV